MATYVQGAITNVQSATLAYPSANTAGNCLVVACHAANGSGTPTISDTRSNTWTKILDNNWFTSDWIECWIAPNCAAGANTITVSGTGVSLQLCVLEYSGVALTSPVDVSATATGTTAASVTTTAASELLVLVLGAMEATGPAQSGAYTSRQGAGGNYGGTNRSLSVYDTTSGAAGSYSNGYTGSTPALSFLVAFKSAAPPASIAISPATAAQGTNPTITVTGTNTNFVSGTTSVSVSGTGITVGAITVASSTSLTVALTFGGSATSGAHTLTVTTGAEAPAATLTITLAVRGNIDYDQVRVSARQGDGARFQMFGTGTPVAGHVASFDSAGNVVDSGGSSLPAWLASHPDAPPATAGSLDDEFSTGTLNAAWTWVNQGSATATFANDCLIITCPAAASTNIRYIYKTCPATPWEVQAKIFTASPAISTSSWHGGLFVGDSSGKIIIWGPQHGPNAAITRYNSTTAGVAQDASISWSYGMATYLRIKDDGTNLTYWLSADGICWLQVLQAGRTAFLSSPSRIGIFVDSENNSAVFLTCPWFRRTV